MVAPVRTMQCITRTWHPRKGRVGVFYDYVRA